MAYFDIALLTQDPDFNQRVAACYAVETLADMDAENPGWTNVHIWKLASTPGFGDAYASALASEVVNPGRDQAVISDSMILSSVQFLLNAEAAGSEPA